jgi:hypothetical protein
MQNMLLKMVSHYVVTEDFNGYICEKLEEAAKEDKENFYRSLDTIPDTNKRAKFDIEDAFSGVYVHTGEALYLQGLVDALNLLGGNLTVEDIRQLQTKIVAEEERRDRRLVRLLADIKQEEEGLEKCSVVSRNG